VVVTDSAYSVIELLKQVSVTPAVSLISRFGWMRPCTILRRLVRRGKTDDRVRKARGVPPCNRCSQIRRPVGPS